jgi:superfamily II DNA or RNA helicase
MKKIQAKFPDFSMLVVVPTTALKDQWLKLLVEWDLPFVQVEVINSVVNKTWDIDMLILDEEHRYASALFRKVFECVHYKLILGLTGTFERLDGRHKIIQKYCPIVEQVTVQEALLNGWVSAYKEYEVLLDVDNIDEYKEYNKNFIKHFEFFNFSFETAMSMLGKNGFENRKEYTNRMCKDPAKWNDYFKSVNLHAMSFMRAMAAKKNFINNHSKKIEIARLIIENRPFSKIITFSNNTKMAEAIGMGGYVYTGKTSKKKGRMSLEEFAKQETGLLHSCSKLNEGLDCPGLSTAIILGMDSSESKSRQRLGRVIRAEEGKNAEIFNLVINGTQELKWFESSHKDRPYIVIDEENLLKVLRNEPFETYRKPVSKFNYRF